MVGSQHGRGCGGEQGFERWFTELTDNRLKRGAFRSMAQLASAIEDYVAHHNENPKGYQWHNSAEEILAKVKRAKADLDKYRSE